MSDEPTFVVRLTMREMRMLRHWATLRAERVQNPYHVGLYGGLRDKLTHAVAQAQTERERELETGDDE